MNIGKDNNVVERIQNKTLEILRRIGVFILLLVGYLILPQLIGLLFYKKIGLSENISLFIGNSFFIVLLICVYFNMFKEKIKDYYNNFSNYFGYSLKYWGFGLIIMFVSNFILSYFVFSGDIATNEEINRTFIQGSPIIGFLFVAVFAPFVEEMIFRFGLRNLVGKSKYFPLISAFVFGIPHVIAGINNIMADYLQFLYVIPYGALGYFFGYIYNKTDNIFCSMVAHFMHNFMCFAAIVLFV